MKRVLSRPPSPFVYEGGGDEVQTQGMAPKDREEEDNEDIDFIAQQVTSIALQKRGPIKRGELSLVKHGPRRQEQKTRAARLEKHLKARWALEERIEEQLSRFHAQYNRAMVPTRLKDLSELLMPKETLPHEMAVLGWIGDWRPSSILDLLLSLTRSTSSLSSSLSYSVAMEEAISQLIHETSIEEAVIDEELSEIQANCILHLPFGPLCRQTSGSALAHVQSEFKKIHQVIAKAHNLRFRALELVGKVLSHAGAAEFLVTFVEIQDLIHQFAMQQKLRKCAVRIPMPLDVARSKGVQRTLAKVIRLNQTAW
ncbi:hypothetical protein NMG60_11004887 [Bertholletia excelsa]